MTTITTIRQLEKLAITGQRKQLTQNISYIVNSDAYQRPIDELIKCEFDIQFLFSLVVPKQNEINKAINLFISSVFTSNQAISIELKIDRDEYNPLNIIANLQMINN